MQSVVHGLWLANLHLPEASAANQIFAGLFLCELQRYRGLRHLEAGQQHFALPFPPSALSYGVQDKQSLDIREAGALVLVLASPTVSPVTRPWSPRWSLIRINSEAMVKKACSTLLAFLADVSRNGIPRLSANV